MTSIVRPHGITNIIKYTKICRNCKKNYVQAVKGRCPHCGKPVK